MDSQSIRNSECHHPRCVITRRHLRKQPEMMSSNLAHAILIFGSVLVLEDIAVLGAALLVVNSMVSLPWAACASFAGIWVGDVGLYALAFFYGRSLLEKPWFKRLFGKGLRLDPTEGWFQKHGVVALLLSRAIPP